MYHLSLIRSRKCSWSHVGSSPITSTNSQWVCLVWTPVCHTGITGRFESDIGCEVCAYCHNHEFDDILEVHHIKGILEFDRSATIAEINNENNLVWLCPNHHKMLEMGLITVKYDSVTQLVEYHTFITE